MTEEVSHVETETISTENVVNQENIAPTEEISTDAEESVEKPSDAPKEKTPEEIEFRKLQRAMSRRNKKLEQERAEKAALKAENETLMRKLNSSGVNLTNPDGSPNPDAYDGRWGEYLLEKAKFEVRKEYEAKDSEKHKTEQAAMKERYVAEKLDSINQQANKMSAEIPDFQSVMQSNLDIVDEFPEYVETAFYECGNAAVAFYNLAKEGKLESLLDMGPYQVIAEISRAASLEPKKPVATSAPRPLTPARGNVTSKSEETMSGLELLKRYKLK